MGALKENMGYASMANSSGVRSRVSKDVHLMTDRTSHMRYLESQLERMNAACSTVSTFDCKIDDMRGGLCLLQDKVVNLARMLDAHSVSVEDTAAAFRDTATDLSRKQQVVHDLLFGGSAKGISSGTLSEASRKFLKDAYEKWAAENQCLITSKVNDVQATVEHAVHNIFRDVEQASSTYQTKLTETKDHLTMRVVDLEDRLESVAASQLNLCSPVVDSMKHLQEETRQQLTVNKSASSHEIASLTRELEQQKLQNRAERCDANTNVQKLQEQTSELAAVVKRLEQACLHSAAPTHVQQAFTGHTHHNSMPQPFQNQPQHPAYTNWQQHDGIGANIHSGMQDVLTATGAVELPPPVSSDRGTMTQQDAPALQAQATNTTSHTRTLAGEAPASRSAGMCTVKSQTGCMERSPEVVINHQPDLARPQSTCSRGTECNLSNDAAQAQPGLPRIGLLGSLPPGSSSGSTVAIPTQPLQQYQTQPTSVFCGTGTAASDLQNTPYQQQQQAALHSNAGQVVVLSASGGIHPLNSAMLQQQHCLNCPADVPMQQQTGASLATQQQPDVFSNQEGSTPRRRRKSHRNPDKKRRSRADSTTKVLDEVVCHAPTLQHSYTTAAGSHHQRSTTPTDSLPASTIWAASPVQDSDDNWKQQHAVHTSQSRAAAQLPPRPEVGRKSTQGALPVAPHHPQGSHAKSQTTCVVPAAKTPCLARYSDDRRAVDSESENVATDSSFVDGDGVQSEDSTCPSTLSGAQKRSRRKQKGKAVGTSSSRGSVRSKAKGSSRTRSSTTGLQNDDDGHAAGINGHLSPLLDTSSTINMQRAVTPDWNLRRTPVSAGSMHSCPACSIGVHEHGSGRRDKAQAVHRCVRSAKGNMRQPSSKAVRASATHRICGDCVTSSASKAQKGGALDGKLHVQQAYLAALSNSSARTPGYAKPTKAALLRQACGSS